MFWNLERIRDYGLAAGDGTIGQIADVFFDDVEWTVRYVVVDTGTWLPGRKVLISPSVLGEPDTENLRFPVALTRDQVEGSPAMDSDLPVDRQHEEALHGYYGWTPYWGSSLAPIWGTPLMDPLMPADFAAAAREPAGIDDEEGQAVRRDPHLRSGHDIEGYHITATDGTIGHVEDFLLGHDWRVRYLVVDTGKWLPGRKVLVAPDWVVRIDWAEREVAVDLTREQVRSGPEYDPDIHLDRGFEERLYDYYGRIPYWI
jgi:hypothetical protein